MVSADVLPHRVLAAVPDMLGDIDALVRCESPSGDLAAVARSADVVSEVGTRRLGVTPERLETGGCTHLRWTLGNGQRHRVLLLGHHDTVWPVGSLTRHPSEVVDGVLRGPGCLDMAAGVVMAFHAVAALDRDADVTILITGDEELGSPTSRALIEQTARRCDAVFVLEAAADDGALKTERKGVSLYRLIAHGRAAHAGLAPADGRNATVELAHQVPAVLALGDPRRGTTVTPTTMSAGTATNTVPARGELAVDVRVTSAVEQRRVDTAMRALRPVTPDVRLELDGGPNRAPLEAAASSSLFARARSLARRHGLPEPRGAAVGGASDGNITAGLGVPTLDGLGACGGGAHAADEHVLVDELAPRTALLAALIADLCDDEPSDDEGARS